MSVFESRKRASILKSFTLVVAATASLLGTTTASAATETTPAQLAGCVQPVNPVRAGATWVHLFRCDNGWHGQITGATPGDEIWVASAKDSRVTGWRRVPLGATSMNSGTVGTYGGPWKACGKDISAGVIRCTARD